MVMRTAYLDVALFRSEGRAAYRPLGDDRYLVVREETSGNAFLGHRLFWYHPGDGVLAPVNQEPWGILKTERLLQEHGVSGEWFPWEEEPTHRRAAEADDERASAAGQHVSHAAGQ